MFGMPEVNMLGKHDINIFVVLSGEHGIIAVNLSWKQCQSLILDSRAIQRANFKMKKIGLIGHPVVDEIYPVKGNVITGYGGVYYNAKILSYLLKDKGEIYLVSKIGSDIHEDFKNQMINLGNINTNNLIKVNQINNRVKLKFYTKSDRKEYSTYVLPALEEDEINYINDYDILLINFVSGRELKWETLNSIRKSFC